MKGLLSLLFVGTLLLDAADEETAVLGDGGSGEGVSWIPLSLEVGKGTRGAYLGEPPEFKLGDDKVWWNQPSCGSSTLVRC